MTTAKIKIKNFILQGEHDKGYYGIIFYKNSLDAQVVKGVTGETYNCRVRFLAIPDCYLVRSSGPEIAKICGGLFIGQVRINQ